MDQNYEISKILSKNDTGENKSHQAGILIPKNPPEILKFFPELDKSKKNPRIVLFFIDDYGREWKFNYIYYNNKLFKGTRNEYRLTGMTNYIQTYGLKEGNEIFLRKNNKKSYFISSIQKEMSAPAETEVCTILKLGTIWKVISI